MSKLTDRDLDWLALESCEIIGFRSGSTVSYDVAGYDRTPRDEIDPALIPQKDALPPSDIPCPAQATFAADPYIVRIAGFRRRDMFGPDDIGKLISERGIPWNDSLGNGLYESLLIDRKYGLFHTLEAPILGFDLPFLDEEWASFKTFYPGLMPRFQSDLREMEAIYHGPLAAHGRKLIVLWGREYPLSLFVKAYDRNPAGVEAELKREIGVSLPPINPQTTQDRAALTRFWMLLRARQARVLEFQAEVLRDTLGEGTIVITNIHELPPHDMEAQARAFDYPAVAIRPLLIADDLVRRYNIAYFTQFYHDLTGKSPIVSVRMNLSAATPQIIPAGNLIRTWYDQAVRHGAGAFYFWTRDYPTMEGAYDGPIPGNPVASTLPEERWKTSLDMLGSAATHCRFIVPEAEIGIFVPNESALMHRTEWQRLYSCFSVCCEARIHTRFISDRQIQNSGIPSNIKVLLIPVLEFLSVELRAKLEAFANEGGLLLVVAGPLYDDEGNPTSGLNGAGQLDSSFVEAIQLDRPGELSTLQSAADVLTKLIKTSSADMQDWVFDVTMKNLSPSEVSLLCEKDQQIQFEPWMYEHGSEWIMPYID
ncbi:hypothetical protein ACFLYO_11890 [Chloroflexota bacterium]